MLLDDWSLLGRSPIVKILMLALIKIASWEVRGLPITLKLRMSLEVGLVHILRVIVLGHRTDLGRLVHAYVRRLVWVGLACWVLMRAMLFSMLRRYLRVERSLKLLGFVGLMWRLVVWSHLLLI